MKKGESVLKLIRATKNILAEFHWADTWYCQYLGGGYKLGGSFFNNYNYNDSFVLAEVKLIYFFF